MENAMVRQRYAKRPVQNRYRRKAPGGSGGLKRIIARQFVICILLLLIIGLAKSINFSAAHFLTDKVKYVISYNVELKSIFTYMEKLAAEIRESISPMDPGKSTVSANGGFNTTRTSIVTQTSITAQASGLAPASLHTPEGDTATLSSSESTQENKGVQTQEDKMIEASSSIENAADQYSTADDAATMPESSVLSASSVSGQQNLFGMILPVEGSLISQFGEKTTDAAGNEKIHTGIDIAAEKGIPIKTVLDGRVTETGSSPVYGGYIRILHANDLQTIYANCSSIIARKGDIVKKGDAVAEIGGTGAASVGTHLHFEIWRNGLAVDPLEYIIVPVR